MLFGVRIVRGIPVSYHLVVEERADGGFSFGITIRRGKEEVFVPDITSKPTEICALLHRMVRGSVTPVTAKDVIEDWVLL